MYQAQKSPFARIQNQTTAQPFAAPVAQQVAERVPATCWLNFGLEVELEDGTVKFVQVGTGIPFDEVVAKFNAKGGTNEAMGAVIDYLAGEFANMDSSSKILVKGLKTQLVRTDMRTGGVKRVILD